MIYGMEMLENRELIDRRDGKVNVTITASDAVSGVKEFYVNIQNTDNTVSKTYHPDADGSIRMEITEDDALFSGDFTVFAYACDQVGNETEISEGTTEFGLEADIIRIREPQDAAFRCGERYLDFYGLGICGSCGSDLPQRNDRSVPGAESYF